MTGGPPVRRLDVVVIGGGQAGLSAAYHLRRAGLPRDRWAVLDAEASPGAAWQHAWDSLTLFSPAEASSLPGWPMPPWPDGFPPASHVVDYLRRYEERYDLPLERPVRVLGVHRGAAGGAPYRLETTTGQVDADAVLSATGTWSRPFWPSYPGRREFLGEQLHAAQHRSPERYRGRHVVVVGGGNSAAQLLAEVSAVTTTTWVTPRPPRFLPDDVDGRALFDVATRRAVALAAGAPDSGGVAALGDVVVVPSVRAARERGALRAEPLFERLTPDGVAWADGRTGRADVVLWCTGFRPALGHLAPLRLPRTRGRPRTLGGTAVEGEPGLHLLGLGDWTGPASATLVGVGRTARAAVTAVLDGLPAR